MKYSYFLKHLNFTSSKVRMKLIILPNKKSLQFLADLKIIKNNKTQTFGLFFFRSLIHYSRVRRGESATSMWQNKASILTYRQYLRTIPTPSQLLSGILSKITNHSNGLVWDLHPTSITLFQVYSIVCYYIILSLLCQGIIMLNR